ncbi:GrlR family regulatory protein [Pseudomonas sp. N-137]|uniref:GrlR family regulatory protein n=1 Tax=Pseudomonas sp. N-137 TaxID=3108452 RepID=UPI002ADED1D0|nr:GrlR family regulatory protein [Pseudomonas sp. N-137]MEA1031023.1 GrlR family regulatory protein [Pseudomonas sp. N-137]
MSNGIFEVDFSSNRPDHGSGLVVVKDGSVNGGDANYLYQGTVPTTSGQFTSQFRVSMWRPGNTNVSGLDNYDLDATGEINYERGSISLTGSVVGAPHIQITLSGRKITPAV